jgi:hypothetical protein
MYRKFSIFLIIFIIFITGNISGAELSFLSFNNKDMTSFNLSFKQYIVAYKKFPEQEKGLKKLKEAIEKWGLLQTQAIKQGAEEVVFGRMSVIKGLLLQAYGLAKQHRFEESKEISIPIRSEIFELHRTLNMLTSEDYMIYFHNGVLHRIEPLIEKRRYLELNLMIPMIKNYLIKFKIPPFGVKSVKEYNRKFSILSNHVENFIQAIKEANNFIDPEYGAYKLELRIKKEFNKMHKIFGELYLSFPNGLVWPKNR